MPDALDHRLLRQIVAIARAGGLRAGAVSLGMSQPPLSRTVRELEAALGVRLFERYAGGMTLTEAGRALVEEAEAILAALHRAEGRVRRFGDAATPLRIGFVSAALDAHLPELLSRIAARGWPAPNLIEMQTDPQAQSLAKAELDLGLLHPPVEAAPGLALAVLGQDGFCAAVPIDHPLAAFDAVCSDDLARFPLVLFPQSQGPVLHAKITNAIAPGGCLNVSAEAARSHTQLALVAAGAGVGLIGASVARSIDYRGVVFRPWADRPSAVSLTSGVMGGDALLRELGYDPEIDDG